MATFVETRDIPIGDLKAHPQNPNRGSVKDIAESLEEFGQFRSIVALPDGTILAGHHVWEAAKKVGLETIRVDVVDADDKEAMKIMLADNRLADLGLGPDLDLLLDALSSLDGDMSATGYDTEYLKMLEEATAGAPPIEDLEDEVGPAPEEEYFRRVTLTLDPTVVTRWEEYRKDYENDNEAFLSFASAALGIESAEFENEEADEDAEVPA